MTGLKKTLKERELCLVYVIRGEPPTTTRMVVNSSQKLSYHSFSRREQNHQHMNRTCLRKLINNA